MDARDDSGNPLRGRAIGADCRCNKGRWETQAVKNWAANFLQPTVDNLAWMKKAACVGKDPSIFFPEKGDSASGNEAILTCFNCEVTVDCAAYKELTESSDGIWGGKYSKRGPRYKSA